MIIGASAPSVVQADAGTVAGQRKRDITAAFAAALVAFLTVPLANDEVVQFGTFFVVGAFCLTGAWAAIDAFRRRAGVCRAVVTVGILYWFGVEALTLATQPFPFPIFHSFYPYLTDRYPTPLVAKGLVAVTLFSLMTVISYWTVPPLRSVVRFFINRDDRLGGAIVDWLCLAIAVLAYIPAYISTGGDVSEMLERMLAMRAYQGDAVVVHDEGLTVHLALLGAAAGAISFARFVDGSKGSRPLQALASIVTLAWVFAGGSRFNLAFVLLPAIFVLTAGRAPSAVQGRWDKRKTIALLGGIVIVVGLQGALRSEGIIEGQSQLDESSLTSIAERGAVGHEHFSAMLLAIDLTEHRDDYYLEPMLPYFLIHWVPRAWWPSKPIPKAWEDYNDTVTGGATFNVTPSVIGQYYMNWGFLGVAYIGLFFGFFARTLDETLWRVHRDRQLLSIVILGMWVVFLFLSFRYLHPLYFAFPAAGTLIWLALSRRRQTRV